MASTQRKTTKKSGSRSKKSAPPPKRPIRREVGGAVLLGLALCVCVGYFGASGLFIGWLAGLLKGLFGYGYWLTAPALLLAGLTLLFHRGRPVVLRTVCALLLPLLWGALGHALFCRETFESSLGILVKLWTSGNQLSSGGAVSGTLAIGFVAVFSGVVSIVIFIVLLLAAVAAALWPVWKVLTEQIRNRPQYEEIPEEPRARVTQEPVPRHRAENPHSHA